MNKFIEKMSYRTSAESSRHIALSAKPFQDVSKPFEEKLAATYKAFGRSRIRHFKRSCYTSNKAGAFLGFILFRVFSLHAIARL